MKKCERKRWKELRDKIVLRDKECLVCKALNIFNTLKPRDCSVHHIIPEQYEKYRFDENNLILLCARHHRWSKESAHQNAFWFVLFLQKYYPEKYKYIVEQIELIANDNQFTLLSLLRS